MQSMHKMRKRIRVIALMGMMWALIFAHSAGAGVMIDESLLDNPILGGQLLVAQDGYVTAQFLGSFAAYHSTLYLVKGDGANLEPSDQDVELFNSNSERGSEFKFDQKFTAGTELIFRLDVRNTNRRFFSGAADRNADGIAHASATTVIGASGILFTTVGFEDLFGGGDNDFNDFMFSLSNVVDPPGVPAPSALALIGLGLVGLGYRQRRHRPDGSR